MKSRLLWHLTLMAAVAAVAAWVTCWLFFSSPQRPGIVGRHYSIHKQLDLTPAQSRAIETLERSYEARWKELDLQIAGARRQLAESLRRDEGYSAEAAAAVETITRCQRELQMATLEHVFAMKPHLTEDQYRRLLDLCADSIESH